MLSTDIDVDRLHRVRKLLEKNNLRDLYPHWIAHNTGSEIAYHGQQHLAIVGLHVHRLAQQYLKSPEKELELLLAGLYHDYNHSGDPSIKDIFNVERAVRAWELASDKHGLGYLRNSVSKLILATEHSANAVTVSEKIIRESDFAYELEPDREIWYQKLTEELGREVNEETTIKFLKKMNFEYLEIAF